MLLGEIATLTADQQGGITMAASGTVLTGHSHLSQIDRALFSVERAMALFEAAKRWVG